jgi:excisionase family DNA binding protein
MTQVAELQPISLTVTQAAKATGISAEVLRRAMKDGKLPGHYVTRHPVIFIEDLRAWIASAPVDHDQAWRSL